MQRFLDEQPSPYVPTTLGLDESFGLYGTIKAQYTENLDQETEYGKILIGDATITVASECVAMLKAILYAGCCRIEERAMACKKAFETCIMAEDQKQFKELLAGIAADDVWVNEIYKAVKELW